MRSPGRAASTTTAAPDTTTALSRCRHWRARAAGAVRRTTMTDGVRLLAAQFDSTVEFFWERMDGLTDEEYLWEPAPNSWSIRPREQLQGTRGLGKGDFQLDWGRTPQPAPMRTV